MIRQMVTGYTVQLKKRECSMMQEAFVTHGTDRGTGRIPRECFVIESSQLARKGKCSKWQGARHGAFNTGNEDDAAVGMRSLNIASHRE